MYLNIELYHSNFISKSCPNCCKPLAKVSKRKFLCSNCQRDIYYRSTPQNQTELLLSYDEKELYEFYKSSFCKYNSESTIKTLLYSDLYPNDALVDKTPKEARSRIFIPMIKKKLSKNLRNKDLGLYTCSLMTLGYLYAIDNNYNAAFYCIAFRSHLLVNGIQNNMKSLDLNLLPLKDEYSYLNYEYLTHIFFLKYANWPFDFEQFKNCYCSMPLENKIKYRYSTQETYLMIKDILKKNI